MKINGQLMKCDRCGRLLFCEEDGHGETDGGYTTWNKFVKAPEGWESFSFAGEKGYKLFCPQCSTEYKTRLFDLQSKFMECTEMPMNIDIQRKQR